MHSYSALFKKGEYLVTQILKVVPRFLEGDCCRLSHYVPVSCLHGCVQPSATGEQKTKPTQNSVRELRGLGLSPDLVSELLLHKHV